MRHRFAPCGVIILCADLLEHCIVQHASASNRLLRVLVLPCRRRFASDTSRSSNLGFHLQKVVTRLEEETRIDKGETLAGQLSRLVLVELDELGYLPFARSGGQLLFHLISKLYERTSVVITTNLASGEWPRCSATPR